MADDKSNDILMKFTMLNGQDVDAEAQSELSPRDPLLKDFQLGKFFQIEDFSFGVEVSDEDPTESPAPGTSSTKAKAPKIKFGRWKSAKPEQVGAIKYPIEMEAFSFTRVIDKASMVFFDSCINSISFQSATLIKRKVTGHRGSKAETTLLSGLHTFLRMDFQDVLVINLEWDDGDTIKEKVKFLFRKLKLQYRRQKPDGTLDTVVSPPLWEHEVETTGSK